MTKVETDVRADRRRTVGDRRETLVVGIAAYASPYRGVMLPHVCVELSDAKGTARATLDLQLGIPVPLRVSDEVSIQFHQERREKEVLSNLTLRRSGALTLFIGHTPTLETLQLPPEVGVTLGERIGTRGDDCGLTTFHDLEVTQGDARTTLRYGATATLGSYVFLHGGASKGHAEGTCFDWTGENHAALVIVAH